MGDLALASTTSASSYGLDKHGLTEKDGSTFWNQSAPALIEDAIRRDEGVLAATGPFCAVTAPYTGRSPNDKFVVEEPSSSDKIWWGKVNQSISEAGYEQLRAKDRRAALVGRPLRRRTSTSEPMRVIACLCAW